MSDPAAILDPFVRGIAAGAMAATAFGVWKSRVSPQARWVTLAVGLSTIAWLITESSTLWGALDRADILLAMAYPVGGLFWLFIATVFEDRPVTPMMLAPPAILLVLGFAMSSGPNQTFDPIWVIFNGLAGLFALHAAILIIRGWRGDLIEGRRQLRAVLLGLVAVFVIAQVLIAFVSRADPTDPSRMFMIARPYGGAIFAVLILAGSVLFLQARPDLFGAARRADAAPDPRVEAADRILLDKLDGFLTSEGWRRERLSIGALADELEVPEHRLRRLINNRLGHRNFADFLNASRIEAAKVRLADPKDARTTVAAIAFDLGYGSLGPFNRAFRAATGSSPTEWRRRALQTSPDLRETD